MSLLVAVVTSTLLLTSSVAVDNLVVIRGRLLDEPLGKFKAVEIPMTKRRTMRKRSIVRMFLQPITEATRGGSV